MNYYLAGPFFLKECSDYFDSFIERCKSTSMANYDTRHVDHNYSSINAISASVLTESYWDEKDKVEPKVLSQDKVFVPGHYKVDFNKIKSEYDTSSFKRVLRQILYLDLDNLNDGLVVWPKGYDLGTMFELGYFIARFIDGNPLTTYQFMKKSLIINDPDEILIECIEYFISKTFYNDVLSNFDRGHDKLFISNGTASLNISKFNCVALNVDCYKSTPFNSILAGILYFYNIPFFTYSSIGADSNVMMVASSLFHVKLDPNKDTQDQLRGEVMNELSKYYWDDSYFDKFKDIK